MLVLLELGLARMFSSAHRKFNTNSPHTQTSQCEEVGREKLQWLTSLIRLWKIRAFGQPLPSITVGLLGNFHKERPLVMSSNFAFLLPSLCWFLRSLISLYHFIPLLLLPFIHLSSWNFSDNFFPVRVSQMFSNSHHFPFCFTCLVHAAITFRNANIRKNCKTGNVLSISHCPV